MAAHQAAQHVLNRTCSPRVAHGGVVVNVRPQIRLASEERVDGENSPVAEGFVQLIGASRIAVAEKSGWAARVGRDFLAEFR